MKKIILILLFAIANVSFNSSAVGNGDIRDKLNLKKIVCATAATISLAAIFPALISDLKAQPGTAQAEVPLVIVPVSALLLSCLMYGE